MARGGGRWGGGECGEGGGGGDVSGMSEVRVCGERGGGLVHWRLVGRKRKKMERRGAATTRQ